MPVVDSIEEVRLIADARPENTSCASDPQVQVQLPVDNTGYVPSYAVFDAVHTCRPYPDRESLTHAQVRMRTARLMGVNLGHRAVGSNAWHFMQRMGINAARLFLYTTIPCALQAPRALQVIPPQRYRGPFANACRIQASVTAAHSCTTLACVFT